MCFNQPFFFYKYMSKHQMNLFVYNESCFFLYESYENLNGC